MIKLLRWARGGRCGVGVPSGMQDHRGDASHNFILGCASWESEEGHSLRSSGRDRHQRGQMHVKRKSADKLDPGSQYWSTSWPFCLQAVSLGNVGHPRANHAHSPGLGKLREDLAAVGAAADLTTPHSTLPWQPHQHLVGPASLPIKLTMSPCFTSCFQTVWPTLTPQRVEKLS